MPGARAASADGTPGDAPLAEPWAEPSPEVAPTPTAPSGTAPSGTAASGTAPSVAGHAADTPAEVAPPTRKFLAKATLVTAVLSIAGALLGLGRDQALAHLFGAGTETDAFLVAWTVPEVAATLLIEDGMAFVLVPAFSLAVARRARGAGGDPVRALIASTLPRLALALVGASALLMAGAPYLVAGLAPGLPDPGLAVDCTRLTATCVLSFGLAGYCSAALRAHRRFLAPAAIYVAYNTGIITAMFVLGGRWGVRSAAAGVAVGGCLMVAAQTPALARQLFGRRRTATVEDGTGQAPEAVGTTAQTPGPRGVTATASGRLDVTVAVAASAAASGQVGGAPDAPGPLPTAVKASGPLGAPAERPVPKRPGERAAGRAARRAAKRSARRAAKQSVTHTVELALITPVLLFALCRQSQVLIERYLASNLPSGAISHLNYAQKVAQIPMTLSLMLCTVTFPVLAQALAEGDTERARTRVERDAAVAACMVLLGAAAVFACAPQIIQLLFQRGAFTAQDTAATATVMRVYSVGLLGHTLVGALVRTYFSAGRPTWYPLAAMTAGIVATSWIGAATVGTWGVCGIAAANAIGITVTAALLLSGMNERRSVRIRTRRVVHELTKPVRAAVCAAVAGALVASRFDPPELALLTGGATVTVVYVLLLRLLDVQAVAPAFRTALRSVTRRLPHARFR
ncbi:lipid II flippase MurJ [Streptomyces sp. BV286]|uniref:murein biosynthesis integral membrane protein MurJ n=1 Tax=Streptomyces sp. BV286 TaxID=2849672 RepID=UPI0035A8A3EA